MISEEKDPYHFTGSVSIYADTSSTTNIVGKIIAIEPVPWWKAILMRLRIIPYGKVWVEFVNPQD